MSSEPFDDPNFRANFERTSQTIDLRTLSAMKALWDAMPWGITIMLPGGEEATLDKFVEPRLREETGDYEFGFDVRESTGHWHIEFFARKTGWGGVP